MSWGSEKETQFPVSSLNDKPLPVHVDEMMNCIQRQWHSEAFFSLCSDVTQLRWPTQSYEKPGFSIPPGRRQLSPELLFHCSNNHRPLCILSCAPYITHKLISWSAEPALYWWNQPNCLNVELPASSTSFHYLLHLNPNFPDLASVKDEMPPTAWVCVPAGLAD